MIEASRSVSVAAAAAASPVPCLSHVFTALAAGSILLNHVSWEGVEDLALDLDGDGLAADLQGLQELALGFGSDMAHQDLPRAGGAAVGDQRGGPVLEVGAGGEEQRVPRGSPTGGASGTGTSGSSPGSPVAGVGSRTWSGGAGEASGSRFGAMPIA